MIHVEKYERACENYAEAKRASCAKMIYPNPASDIVRLAKITTYYQNNNIQWYFHIVKAQKSLKSS